MAAKGSSGRQRGNRKKESEPKKGRCYDCVNAYLMRSMPYNPIVSECTVTGERWVASMTPECGRFARRISEPVINPMKYLNRK